jgi:hypothetical protein
VRPTPLFRSDVDSAGSDDGDKAAVKETLATQGPEDLGEVEKLTSSFGLMELLSCIDMWEPWIEGPRSEKVSSLWIVIGSSLTSLV